MLRGISVRLIHNPIPADVAALFARAKAHGADSVAIIPHHYVSLAPGTPNLSAPPASYRIPWFIYPDVGQDPTHPFQNTPSADLVYAVCAEAEAQGLRVLLKPHIDSYAADWRGYISVRARRADWYYAYKERFLRRYIQIAKALKDPILCLGTELYTVTKELGWEFWRDLAVWTKATNGGAYRGMLTYAANWGIGADAEYERLREFWRFVDYIGIDGYFPLVPRAARPDDPAPSFADLLAGWDRPLGDQGWEPAPAADLLRIAGYGNKFLFTEIGCGNHRRTAEAPGEDADRFPAPVIRDDGIQADYYRAFRQRFDGEPKYGGFFGWEYWLGAAPPVSHSIIDHPAEEIAFRDLAPPA
jgi:hypothetical protein